MRHKGRLENVRFVQSHDGRPLWTLESKIPLNLGRPMVDLWNQNDSNVLGLIMTRNTLLSSDI